MPRIANVALTEVELAKIILSCLEEADPSAYFHDCPDADSDAVLTTVDGRFDLERVAAAVISQLKAGGVLPGR